MAQRERTAADSEGSHRRGDEPAGDEGAARPEQHAALNEAGGEDEKNAQDTTDSTTWDTDQHSDAPGPFGTG